MNGPIEMKLLNITIVKNGQETEIPSLFGEYLNKEISNYTEPERKGTPKGDKIGFPKKKYAACLLVALTNLSLKTIAEKFGTKFGFSYGLLRKWNSEDEFKAEKQRQCLIFARIVLSYISEKTGKALGRWRDYHEGKIDNEPGGAEIKKVALDFLVFNKNLLAKIEEIVGDHLVGAWGQYKEGKRDFDDYSRSIALYSTIADLISVARNKKVSANFPGVEQIKTALFFVKDIISEKRNLTVQEQRQIITMIKGVEKYLDN